MRGNSPTKLILVDDDPDMLRLLKVIIDKHFQDQLQIVEFTDPVEAMAEIEKGEFDLVLTDLEMPELNGIEILSLAKHRNPTCQVLLLTGRSHHEALLEAMEKGASDYLLKPVDQESLLALLQQAHERRLRWQLALADTWRKKRELSAG